MSLFLLFVIGCAKSDNTQPEPVDPKKSVQLLFFSAPWCGECKPKLTSVESILAPLANQIHGKVYVVEGKHTHSKPTPEVVAEYASKLGTAYQVLMDPWQWTTYKQFYTDNQYAVPGCVLEDAKGVVLKVYERGIFSPEEVLADVQSALK